VTLLKEQPVVLITGISASGKSTVADKLARRFERGVHVKGDIYRRMVVAGRHEMTSSPSDEAWRQLRLRYRLGAATADAYHEAGFSVVVQDVVIGSVLEDYVAAIRSTPLVVVVLAPRAEVVEQREQARGKQAYRDGYNNIIELDVALREATPRIGLWLDNSDQHPDETVDEIIDRGLDAGRVE
jgi:cytidylate kinase